MFTRILVANRGEIACRIIRTLKKLQITAIAVYSDADAQARHVREADEAYGLGSAPARESYLSIEKIIAAAKASGAEAIHPGYGFLSENADFARACEANNIVFIGPPIHALEKMGSKAEAKKLMQQHGVPLLPGYQEEDQSEKTLLQAAKKIGFPLLIKASYGGGGRGMRIVEDAKSFASALEGAKREALNGFGNDHVILEKYLRAPRHVEVQIFADQQQHYLYLFERDCSIQRRHQKVIEEAPAPHINTTLRKELGEAAIRAAKAVNYVGAGTVEFLLGEDHQFYFMEMNTRLQVEHPVTEMITGEDLVAWQIQVADGLALPKKQNELTLQGAAIEVRLCAEDPTQHFLPATGKIEALTFNPAWLNVSSNPSTTDLIRVDTGYLAGDSVSIYYDSLISKIIAFAKDRETARLCLLEALDTLFIQGIKTNRTLLSRILQQQDFITGTLSTNFIVTHEKILLDTTSLAPDDVLIGLSLWQLQQLEIHHGHTQDPWKKASGFRLYDTPHHTFSYQQGEETRAITLQKMAGGWQTQLNGQPIDCQFLQQQDQKIQFSMSGKVCEFYLFFADNLFTVHQTHQTYLVPLVSRFGTAAIETATHTQPSAPMPGRIMAVHVKAGDTVKATDPLLTMEAMKMEHCIRAPYTAIVKTLHYKAGDIVAEQAALVELEEVKK